MPRAFFLRHCGYQLVKPHIRRPLTVGRRNLFDRQRGAVKTGFFNSERRRISKNNFRVAK